MSVRLAVYLMPTHDLARWPDISAHQTAEEHPYMTTKSIGADTIRINGTLYTKAQLEAMLKTKKRARRAA